MSVHESMPRQGRRAIHWAIAHVPPRTVPAGAPRPRPCWTPAAASARRPGTARHDGPGNERDSGRRHDGIRTAQAGADPAQPARLVAVDGRRGPAAQRRRRADLRLRTGSTRARDRRIARCHPGGRLGLRQPVQARRHHRAPAGRLGPVRPDLPRRRSRRRQAADARPDERTRRLVDGDRRVERTRTPSSQGGRQLVHLPPHRSGSPPWRGSGYALASGRPRRGRRAPRVGLRRSSATVVQAGPGGRWHASRALDGAVHLSFHGAAGRLGGRPVGRPRRARLHQHHGRDARRPVALHAPAPGGHARQDRGADAGRPDRRLARRCPLRDGRVDPGQLAEVGGGARHPGVEHGL